MKKINRIILMLSSLAILGLISWSGCKESPTETEENQGDTRLQIEDIIFDPIAPLRGDTVMLTAVVTTGSYADVDYPSFSWQVNGGVLLANNNPQVLWVSPDTSRICGITVTASNSQSSAQATRKVFVTESASLIVNSNAATLIPTGGDSLYYLHSSIPPEDIFFEGFTIYLYADGGFSPVTFSYPGVEYKFSKDRSFAVHQYGNSIPTSAYIPVDIILDNLSSGMQIKLTQDEAAPYNQRRYHYEHPYFSPMDPIIVFQGFHPDVVLPDQGPVDTFDVYVYNIDEGTITQVTHQNLNVFPSFSSDGSFLTFISDRDTTFSLEIYAMPVVNGSVDTSSSSLIQLTHIGSWIPETVPPEKPLFIWNPSPDHPLMAIIDSNGELRLLGTDGTFDKVQGINDEIIDMAWGPDGIKLAVIAGTSIYLVGLDRSSQLIDSYPATNVVGDIAWSGDGQYLIYNVQRSGEVWMELIDLSGTLNLQKPLRITNRFGAATIAQYRPITDISPYWMSFSSVYALAFGSDTPGVMRLDLTGLTR